MKIVVSACLLGQNCKYNGKNNYNPKLCALLEGHEVIPVCPEMMGGLKSPRIPCEMNPQGRVIGTDGKDYTDAFEAGAQAAIDRAVEEGAELAVLQKRSPSCGSSCIYDGSFSGKLIEGDGLFARKCKSMKIPVLEAESEKTG